MQLRISQRTVYTALVLGVVVTVWVVGQNLMATEGLACSEFASVDWTGPVDRVRTLPDLTVPLLGHELANVESVFSVSCEGWLYVTTPARFTFLLDSDDGSDLVIDGHEVIDNRGVHGRLEKLGTWQLMPGPHQLRVRYAQAGGDAAFSLLWARDAEPLSPIPPAEISLRPLDRVEHNLRPLAWPARLFAVALAFVVLGRAWRREILHLARTGLAPVLRVHNAVVAHRGRALLLLLVAAIAARVVLMLTTSTILWADSYAYYLTAEALRQGDWLSHEIFRTPGFPLFVAAFLPLTDGPLGAGPAIVAAQHVLGVVATLLLYDIGCVAFSPAAAFYGALLWTISPLPLYYETALLSEALFGFLLIVLTWTTVRALPSPGAASFAATGVLVAGLVLTRPVGRGFVAVVIPLLWWAGRRRRRSLMFAATAVALYVGCTIPWMYANQQSYGFFGISRGEGFGLFMRAYDVERFQPPHETTLPAVRMVFDDLAPTHAYLHYPMRDELDFRRGLTARQTDDAMGRFAWESIREHPVAFVTGIALDWVALLMSPHRSLGICQQPDGAVVCGERNVGMALGPFSSAFPVGRTQLKTVVAAYMSWAYWLTPLLAPLAAFGAVMALKRRTQGASQLARVLLIVSVLYFTVLAVSFNTVEDRYRLPVDGFILMLAIHGLTSVLPVDRVRQVEPQ